MKRIKRNQVVITALVAMIGISGYLNYLDNKGLEANPILLSDDGEVVALIPEAEGITESVDVISVDGTTVDNIAADTTSETTTNLENVVGVFETTDDNPEILTEAEKVPGEAIFVNSNTSDTYFVQAKLEREQARAKQQDILNEMLNNQTLGEVQKEEAASEMLDIQERIEKETAAEAMIEAKGFSDVYVRIDDETVDVVVNKDTLSEAEIAQIEDIVTRKTGFPATAIRISTLNS